MRATLLACLSLICSFEWSQLSLWMAHVAQSAERVLGKEEVISSILILGSNLGGSEQRKLDDGEGEVR